MLNLAQSINCILILDEKADLVEEILILEVWLQGGGAA